MNMWVNLWKRLWEAVRRSLTVPFPRSPVSPVLFLEVSEPFRSPGATEAPKRSEWSDCLFSADQRRLVLLLIAQVDSGLPDLNLGVSL